MRPDKTSIAGLFNEPIQYLIPLFQRGYVWELKDPDKSQVRYLWEDIADQARDLQAHQARAKQIGTDKPLRPLQKHFLGSIVVGERQERSGGRVDAREVIDGQQRLTTLQILFYAFRDIVQPLNDQKLNYDLERYTVNPDDYGAETDRLKVLPTSAGRDELISLFSLRSLDAVIDRYPLRRNKQRVDRPKMVEAYLFFSWMIEHFLRGRDHDESIEHKRKEDFTLADEVIRSIRRNNAALNPPLEGEPDIEKARLLLRTLERQFDVMKLRLEEEDDAQVIFETLNARGEPLKPSDLIRNFIFLDAQRNSLDVDGLYDKYWSSFDSLKDHDGTAFWSAEQRQGRLKTSRLDLFFYHYTTLRLQSVLKVSHVFSRFKDWWGNKEDREITQELHTLNRLSDHFQTCMSPVGDDDFDRFCRRLLLLDTTSQTPIVLAFLERYGPNAPEFKMAADDIESYLVRRFVCGLTTKAYNRTFNERILPEIVRSKEPCSKHLRHLLLSLEGESQCWPNDDEFERAWRANRLYKGSNTNRVQGILLGLEEKMTGPKQELIIKPDGLTVEHVLPQKAEKADYPLPDDDQETALRRDRLVHSIGNLTLVTSSFNASLSNAAFAIKRPEIAGQSQLRLNSYFQSLTNDLPWNEDTILARAAILWPIAKEKWGRPNLD
ncbi:MAG: hypothetical protein DHS20C05_08070 [Hyphococcus sp.]|nr:MAG: hypothetical protein DHS20C05_08070 [Marinicaulis sp.]